MSIKIFRTNKAHFHVLLFRVNFSTKNSFLKQCQSEFVNNWRIDLLSRVMTKEAILSDKEDTDREHRNGSTRQSPYLCL